MQKKEIGPVTETRCAHACESEALAQQVETAVRQIPPLWPLDESVAVNPFLGQSGITLAETAARLARVGGVPVTMPRAWYLARIADGRLTTDDLAGALSASPHAGRPRDVAALKAAAAAARPAPAALPTVADLAGQATGRDWPGLVADRIGAWAGGYFDAGQALWAAPRTPNAWAVYRAYATHDLTPEIQGLKDFAAFVAQAPDDPLEAIERAVARLGLPAAALDTYFHQLLLSLGGWAQLARQRHWQAAQAGQSDPLPATLLAIRLLWEEALFAGHETAIAADWRRTREAHAAPVVPNEAEIVNEILQDAAERAAQRDLAAKLAEPAAATSGSERPKLQAVFCIDVRSEVVRRALESVDPEIRTLGFAGFFGIFTRHWRFASDLGERRLPVFFAPSVSSTATGPDNHATDATTRYAARAKRAWGRFKLAAVSSFAFVEAMGPVYIGKLLRDAFGLKGPGRKTEPVPRFAPEPDLETRIAMAEGALRAMSLTKDFARVVLFAGHGASVTNNPFASGLHCGACGGQTGEVNARLLARLLNEAPVRAGLAQRGIAIPEDTLFVAALHDTTTDAVTLYDSDTPAPRHRADLDRLRQWLAVAGQRARAERALGLPRAESGTDVPARARDWAELRPEWGLAGCRAFIAAPRARTSGRRLDGRAFLHDYDWATDRDNGAQVLELILTAPVVVASWISLQYYGSTVAPATFGSGSKLLHNVVGGVGVLEGNGGPLRAGLPWQSLHDGTRLVHEPLRLSVCIAAPCTAMTRVLERHDALRALFDNRWLHLFALDGDGRMTHRYRGGLDWEEIATRRPADAVLETA